MASFTVLIRRPDGQEVEFVAQGSALEEVRMQLESWGLAKDAILSILPCTKDDKIFRLE